MSGSRPGVDSWNTHVLPAMGYRPYFTPGRFRYSSSSTRELKHRLNPRMREGYRDAKSSVATGVV